MNSELEGLEILSGVYASRKYDSIEAERKHTLAILREADSKDSMQKIVEQRSGLPSVRSKPGDYEAAIKLLYESESIPRTLTEIAYGVSAILGRRVEAPNIGKQFYRWREEGRVHIAYRKGRSDYYVYHV